METLSVLMSVYKAEKPEFLDRALKSVWVDQTLKPNQIVLIVDGPIGECLKNIVAKWKNLLNEKLFLIENVKNLGLTKSLNKGIKIIDSDYIARMDSDDISHPLRFERQVAYLNAHPDVVVVGGALQEFDGKHKCLNVRYYPKTNDEILKYICKASPLAHPTVMMRKQIFDMGIKYNEKYRKCQDVALWFDILKAGYKISNLAEITIYFRLDNGIFKRRSWEIALLEFQIYMKGIKGLHGIFSLKYFYPISRLLFRLMPVRVVKWIYGSRLRGKLLNRI